MGSHRSNRRATHRGRRRWRGVSKGPVLAIAAIGVAAGLIAAWFIVRDRAQRSAADAAAHCLDGHSTLIVAADPDIGPPLATAAQRYNAVNPRVRDYCVSVEVTARPTAAVATALARDSWDSATLGPPPGLWIPQSTAAIRDIAAARLAGSPVPLARSPIVLAVPGALRTALEKARTSWADLPALQQGSLADAGLPDWGGLRLGLPPDDLTLLTAATVAAETTGTAVLSDEAARSQRVVAAVSGLAAGAPKPEPAERMLVALAANLGPAGSIHAVPVTAAQLQRRQGPLVAWQPAGARPAADYPAVPLAGNSVNQIQKQTAVLFTEFLRKAEQAKLFSDAGFALPPTGGVPAPAAPLAAPAGYRALLATLASPVLGVNSTVLVDISASMASPEGTGTRLSNVTAALLSQITALPPTARVGLWSFGPGAGGDMPYKVNSPTAILADPHRTALMNQLPSLQAASTRSGRAYETVRAAYRAAVLGYSPGRANSVLVITDGPEDDSGMTSNQLAQAISATADKARPVRIDVVAIARPGSAAARSAPLRAIAEQTSGTYTTVAVSNSAELGAAVNRALTAGQR